MRRSGPPQRAIASRPRAPWRGPRWCHTLGASVVLTEAWPCDHSLAPRMSIDEWILGVPLCRHHLIPSSFCLGSRSRSARVPCSAGSAEPPGSPTVAQPRKANSYHLAPIHCHLEEALMTKIKQPNREMRGVRDRGRAPINTIERTLARSCFGGMTRRACTLISRTLTGLSLFLLLLLPSTGSTPAHAESGTWRPAGTMSTPRAGHTATVLSNGELLVAGGLRRH